MKRIALIALLFIAFATWGQKPPAKFGDIPMEDMKMTVYPNDSSAEAVILVDYAESAIKYSEHDGFQIIFERLQRIKILTKEGLKWGDFSIPLYHNYDNEEKIKGLKVVTYNLENGKIVQTKTKSETFIREKYNANLNFTKVTWANVKEGSVLEIAYTITSDFLFNFQDWEFQTTIPTRWSEYRASIPEYYNYEKFMQGYVALSVNENEQVQNSFTINSSERSPIGGARTTTTSFSQDKIEYQENRFRWAAKDVPAFKKEPFMTGSRDYVSKINFELAFTKFSDQFSNPGIKRYMGTWEDISKTYLDRVGKEITGNNSLKNKVEEILAGVSDPEQKVATVFNYVRQNILWDGANREYPENSPKKTLEEKKGNSAEINFLLASLLEKAEINVSPVLLSTRDHGFVRETMPVSTQFNYVVCLAKVGQKSILLDATDKFLPVGMLPERCLNGKGLVASAEGFQWVSLQSPTKTKTFYSADLKLTDSGELKGSLKIDKTGYSSADARKSYLANGEKDYLKAFTEGRSWTLSKSEFQNVNEIHQPFKEIHELTINEHITEAGSTIYLSPFILAKAKENPFKLEKRTYPVDFAHAFDEMYTARITIPEGYVIDEMPKSKVIALPENTARYSYNAAQAGNTISITSSLVINRSLFTQEEYPNLREFYSQLVAKQAEQIVLKKKQ
ncbi:MAG: DUF3857 domain-containing protein [Bacteroidetes bacterium]|nr:DUF3857 domain-containing protein [Bacteroidota bacterium]MBI3483002.1 DUF3857 domain-containing protein [Bacteroidota bacterium]